jgi:predicted dehydrogenase
VKILVVGLGRQGMRHLRIAREAPGVEVAGTVDPFVPELLGTRHFHKVDEALKAVEVDAAVVATPTTSHAETAIRLLEAGVPTLVEKPIAATVAEGEEMAQTAHDAGVLLAVGFVERFNPAVSVVSAMLRRGTLGHPICMSFRRLGLPPASPPDVDVIHDLAIHDIDVFGLLAGTAPRLVGAISWPIGEPAQSAHLLLQAAGVNGSIQANWRTPVRVRDFTVTTDTCYIEGNYTTQRVDLVQPQEPMDFIDFGEFQTHYGSARRVELELPRAEPLAAEQRAFVAAVQGLGSPLLGTANDGIAALRIAQAAERLRDA